MNKLDPQQRGASCLGRNFPAKFNSLKQALKQAQVCYKSLPDNQLIDAVLLSEKERKSKNEQWHLEITNGQNPIGYITVENKPYYYA